MKIKAISVGMLLAGAIAYAASVSPVTVIDSLAALLAKPAIRGETVMVLGSETPFDAPIRIARHFTNILYPIDNVSVFAATNGGEWFLTSLGSVTPTGPVAEVSITCPDDTSVHKVTIGLHGGYYTLEVDQSPSVVFPTSLYLEANDGTSHRITIARDPEVPAYRLAVVQELSSVAPQTLVMTHPDATQHTVSLVNLGGIFALQVQQ